MRANSISEYLSIIEKLKINYTYTIPWASNAIFGEQTYKPHFVFRGHSNNEKYQLLPGVFREKKMASGGTITQFSQLEFNILNDFISEACKYVKDIPVDNVPAWLEVAQHFGVPTRLLDFTENPLVALYFACVDCPTDDASVWIINEPAYNQKFHNIKWIVPAKDSNIIIKQIVENQIINLGVQPKSVDNNRNIQFPWIYKPNYYEERMNLQSSIFMIWGTRRSPIDAFVDEKDIMSDENVDNQRNGILAKIIIPSNKKSEVLEQLSLCGVNEKTIYPGLDGIGRYVREKYSAKGY